MLLMGARIAEYRKAAHMSQEEFAVKIGVSRQAVSKCETAEDKARSH
ncbi:MAG: helix-turn-helix transcriptional regulator [Coprococcus sp.]